MQQPISVTSIANFRQLGGLSGKDGRKIINNRLFRSSALDMLNTVDIEQLENLPTLTILDYRDEAEAHAKADRPLINGHYINIPANPVSLQLDAKVVQFTPEHIEAINVERFMIALYQQLPFNNPAWQVLINQLQQDNPSAILQHCAVGKDRTGIGCAITLLLLGCERDSIFANYMETQGRLDDLVQQVIKQWQGRASSRAVTHFSQLLSVQESWLAAAFTAIEQRYGSTQRWLFEEYGVDQSLTDKIQNNWLTT